MFSITCPMTLKNIAVGRFHIRHQGINLILHLTQKENKENKREKMNTHKPNFTISTKQIVFLRAAPSMLAASECHCVV